MPRKPSVWYRAESEAWFTTFKGKQTMLQKGPNDFPDGPVYTAALNRFLELSEVYEMGQTRETTNVRAVIAAYLAAMSPHWRPATRAIRERSCRLFSDAIGKRPLTYITPNVAIAVIDGNRGPHYRQTPFGRACTVFGDGAASAAIATIKAVTAWAYKQGIVKTDLLRALASPEGVSIGAEAVISDDEHSAVLAALCKRKDHPLRALIVCLHATGARPSELCAAEARYWRPAINAIVYPSKRRARKDSHRHKTSAKGKDRIIRFEGDALPIVLDLLQRFPIGPLFRTHHRKRWTVRTIDKEFRRRVQTVCERSTVTPKSYRHRFATKWLESGGDIHTLSRLIGASPQVIIHHYGHPDDYSARINNDLAAFLASE